MSTAENKLNRMLSQAPDYYRESEIYKGILGTGAEELAAVDANNTDLGKQFRVNTSTWGLETWEKSLAIPINTADSLDVRRGRVLAKLLGNFPVNMDKIKQVVNAFVTGKTATIEEILNEYAFRARIPVDDIVSLQEIKKNVNRIQPAHLEFLITVFCSQLNPETVTARTVHRFSSFGLAHRLDGQYNLDGAINLSGYAVTMDNDTRLKINMDVVNLETINATLTTYNDVYYLDGAYSLNGEKPLDAAIITETL